MSRMLRSTKSEYRYHGRTCTCYFLYICPEQLQKMLTQRHSYSHIELNKKDARDQMSAATAGSLECTYSGDSTCTLTFTYLQKVLYEYASDSNHSCINLSGSRDVIGHVTIRFPIGHFLFASSDSFSVRHTV